MKKVFLLILAIFLPLKVFADTYYICGGVPFIPNKAPEQSCGIYCEPGNITTFPIMNPDYYALKLYSKAKENYDNGKCEVVTVLNSYPESECGGTVYEKKIPSSEKWVEIIGGNEACRIQQFKREVEKLNNEIFEILDNF